MYCSDFYRDDCTKYESIVSPSFVKLNNFSQIRVGLPNTHAYGLEKLFWKYGVDLELWAHEHSYERMYPVYNRRVRLLQSGCKAIIEIRWVPGGFRNLLV